MTDRETLFIYRMNEAEETFNSLHCGKQEQIILSVIEHDITIVTMDAAIAQYPIKIIPKSQISPSPPEPHLENPA